MTTLAREQRRALARMSAKQPAVLKSVPRDQWPNQPEGNCRLDVMRSREFLVQIFRAPPPAKVRLSVNRTALLNDLRWADGITWDDLQRVKREAGYANDTAVEVYPSDRDLVDVANMRHLWVLEAPPAYAWGRTELMPLPELPHE